MTAECIVDNRGNHLFPVWPEVEFLFPKRVALTWSIEGEAVASQFARPGTALDSHISRSEPSLPFTRISKGRLRDLLSYP